MANRPMQTILAYLRDTTALPSGSGRLFCRDQSTWYLNAYIPMRHWLPPSQPRSFHLPRAQMMSRFFL